MKRRSIFRAICCVFLALVPAIAWPTTPSLAAHRAMQLSSNVFGIPFPTTHNPDDWAGWRERVNARFNTTAHPRPADVVPSPTGSSPIETIAGSVPYQKLGNALQTGIGDGNGMVADSGGNLYIATGLRGVVLKVDAASNISIYAGDPTATGPATQSGDGGPATKAHIPIVYSLAIDKSNNIYISDYLSHTVRMVNAASGIIQTVAGTPDKSGYSGDGGPATAALLAFPTSIAVDGGGNLFITDGRYIREVVHGTGSIQTLTGQQTTSQCSLSFSQACPLNSLSLFSSGASTLAAHGNTLYVAATFINTSSAELLYALLSVDLPSGVATLLAGGEQDRSNPISFTTVQRVAVDSTGTIYISDPNTVSSFSPSTRTLTLVAGNQSTTSYSGDGGPAIDASLGVILSLATTPSGSVLVNTVNRILSFSVGGNIRTVAGGQITNIYGDGGPGTLAGLSTPFSAATDAQGNVYFTDLLVETGDSLVRRIDAVTGIVTTVAGNGDYDASLPSDGTEAVQVATSPASIALNGSKLFIASNSGLGSVQMVDLQSGQLTTLLHPVPLSRGIAFDGNKTLYVAAQDHIVAYDINTGDAPDFAGDSSAVSGGGNGDGGPALTASLGWVSGLALDGKGHLYIGDLENANVRVVALSTGIIQTLAGHAGITGYSGDGGPATAATFNEVDAVACDSSGHLYIADANNASIRVVDLTTGIINTIAGTGVLGFGGDGGQADKALLYGPVGVATDARGNLFIADTSANRIRRVLIHPTQLTAALTSSTTSAMAGDTVTLTATYNGLSFGFAPTGSITFLNGATSLGTADLAADDSGNYIATLNTSAIPAGNASITAQYDGDAHYASVTTAAVTLTVAAPVPSFALSAAPASLSIKQGSSGSITLTITPKNGFNQQVSFSCDNAALPPGVSCSFSLVSLTPSSSVAVTSVLTVQTTGAKGASLNFEDGPLLRWWVPAGGSTLALLLFSLPRSRRKVWQTWLGIVLVVLCIGGATGCSAIEKAISSDGVTPTGTYSISVTASAGSGSTAVSQPLTLAVIVTQ